MEMNLEIITSSHSAATGEHGPAQKLLRGAWLTEAPVQTSFRNVPDVDKTGSETQEEQNQVLSERTGRWPCWAEPVASVTDLSSLQTATRSAACC